MGVVSVPLSAGKFVPENCFWFWRVDTHSIFCKSHSAHIVHTCQASPHVKRHYNKAADALANRAMDEQQDHIEWRPESIRAIVQAMVDEESLLLHCRFDGGYRKDQCRAAAGVRVECVTRHGSVSFSVPIAEIGVFLPAVGSYEAELAAAFVAIQHAHLFWTKILNVIFDLKS